MKCGKNIYEIYKQICISEVKIKNNNNLRGFMDENKAKNAVVQKEKRKNELEILFSFELGK